MEVNGGSWKNRYQFQLEFNNNLRVVPFFLCSLKTLDAQRYFNGIIKITLAQNNVKNIIFCK